MSVMTRKREAMQAAAKKDLLAGKDLFNLDNLKPIAIGKRGGGESDPQITFTQSYGIYFNVYMGKLIEKEGYYVVIEHPTVKSKMLVGMYTDIVDVPPQLKNFAKPYKQSGGTMRIHSKNILERYSSGYSGSKESKVLWQLGDDTAMVGGKEYFVLDFEKK